MQMTIQLTPQGMLINNPIIQEWLRYGVDVTQESERIIIRPKLFPKKKRLAQILAEAGLLVSPPPLPFRHRPLSIKEQETLSHKFSVGRPLSEIIIEERTDRI